MTHILYILIVIIILGIGAMLARAMGNFMYHLLCLDIFRIPFVLLAILIICLVATTNKFSFLEGATYITCFIGFFSYFFEKFYHTYKGFFIGIVNIMKHILKIGSKTGRFLIEVNNGVHSGKQKLKKETNHFKSREMTKSMNCSIQCRQRNKLKLIIKKKIP
jgi:hypothetical protein